MHALTLTLFTLTIYFILLGLVAVFMPAAFVVTLLGGLFISVGIVSSLDDYLQGV